MRRTEQDQNEQTCPELFQRAFRQNDVRAWEWLQHRFSGMMSGWLRRHPQRKNTSRYESEENDVALGFERFWYATACKGHVQYCPLAAASGYFCASLKMLATLPAYAG
jgi:hypothetical protein